MTAGHSKQMNPQQQTVAAEGGNLGLMREVLSEGISRARGERRVVRELERQPFSGSSSFSTERIRARMDNGEWLDVFFKDLNPAGLLQEARRVREAGLERSLRELRMYQEILASLRLDTPVVYGSCCAPEEGICWLFLEDAGPKRLSRLGDFSLWVEATRWVARLHAVDARAINDRADFLPCYDSSHFHDCARRLEGRLSNFDTAQQAVIAEGLDRYRRVVDELCELPRHLIHGEYFGKNVMIRPGERDDAVAVIDWETAAIGPRCVDLVSITAGRWTAEQRAVMCRAYISQYEIETGEALELKSLVAELDQVALYRSLWWLGFWSHGDDAHINRWVAELAAVMGRSTTRAL